MLKNKGVVLNGFRIKRRYVVALMIFIFFFVVYLIFLTNDHFSADGAVRCLDFFWKKKVILHGNSHILYPLNVYAWYKMTSLILGDSNDPFNFIRRIQVMNALASSIILALSYLIYLKFLKKETFSFSLVCVFGISNAFLNHAISSSESIVAFLFFIISFYILTIFSDNKRIYIWVYAFSAFIFAYSIMSHVSMLFCLPFILAYLYHKTQSKKLLLGFFMFFIVFLGALFILSAYHKGFSTSEIDKAFFSGEFVKRGSSHARFQLKNFPQYFFGMVNAFFHIDAKYDLPTYIWSLKNFEINSWFSVIFGLILGLTILILVFSSNIFKGLRGSLMKMELSPLTLSLIYFFSASIPIIIYTPMYDKAWIIGLYSFLLLAGIIYTRVQKTLLIKFLFFIAILIMIVFNSGFLVKSKKISEGVVCLENSLKMMKENYILLGTWSVPIGPYISAFHYNNASKYYKIPNLAMDYGLDTVGVINFLKAEFCNGKLSAFYVTSDVLVSEHMWNTFLGDEMKMNYSLFHSRLLDYNHKITECVYELDRTICET